MDASPSKDALIDGLKSLATTLDGVPTVREMRSEGPYSPYYYKESFGSWHGALRAAGIQPTHGVDPDVDRDELIADLRRVDGQCEGPPRRRQVDEYGNYAYSVYDDEFDSFLHALKEAGIEPTEKQYRFSAIETPEEKKGSANIQTLREEGPTPGGELPNGMSANDRQLGMWKFDMSSGATQPADPIYYLDGEHAPELVLRRFFTHNPHVLEYRDPHGIKLDIKNHKPSWKETGQNLIDELVEDGFADTELRNAILVDVTDDETLQHCFQASIRDAVDTAALPLDSRLQSGTRPIWGFPRAHEDAWNALTQSDAILFSTKPGYFTHYLTVDATTTNPDAMADLWVEYDDEGVRTGGIERPWPHLVIGNQLKEIAVPVSEFAEEADTALTENNIQWLPETALSSFKNSYGSIETYLRNRTQTNESPLTGLDPDNLSVQDVVEILIDISPEDLPTTVSDTELAQIERETREEAFREGIYEAYSGCAICGQLIESPNGSIDIEAAHIVPKADGGPDLIQNGLGLCSKHHWAFDNGWFKLTTDYEIHVRDHPELEGYNDLSEYHGQTLYLPADDNLSPHPQYLAQRLSLQEK